MQEGELLDRIAVWLIVLVPTIGSGLAILWNIIQRIKALEIEVKNIRQVRYAVQNRLEAD